MCKIPEIWIKFVQKLSKAFFLVVVEVFLMIDVTFS